MVDENQMIHPGRPGDDGDAALDDALAAADEDMIAAISSGLDLDVGLARILKDLGGSSAAPLGIQPQPPARPGKRRGMPGAARSRSPSPRGAGAVSQTQVTALIRDTNASDSAARDQFLRARRAVGIASRSEDAAQQAAAEAERAEIAYRAIQARQPRRRAPFPRQVTLTLGTAVLDGLTWYSAAWARNRKRAAPGSVTGNPGAGAGRPPSAIARACLLAAAAGSTSVGYRALRTAETPRAWRARQQARKARQAARAARAAADRNAAERDRLIDAYLGHVRQLARQARPAGLQPSAESVIREHLLGELPWEQDQAVRPPSAGKPIYRSLNGSRLTEVFGRWYASSRGASKKLVISRKRARAEDSDGKSLITS
jgi:hypothetical protein